MREPKSKHTHVGIYTELYMHMYMHMHILKVRAWQLYIYHESHVMGTRFCNRMN